jgi:cytochrome c oxidase subunit 3
MDLGTIEPLTQPPSRRKRIRRTSGGSGRGSGNGGKNGGNGGGSDGPDSNNPEQDSSFAPPDKARVVTWFLLPTVMMTFAGMMGAYIVVATNRQSEWQPFALPNQLWISTVILAVSSYTLQTAKNAIDREQHQKAKNWLVSQGLYMRGNPYAGFFYILTIAHAVHVLGGVIALGAIQLRAWYPSADENELEHRRNLARSVTYYWHFLGLLWVVLLGLLAFWK